MFGEGSGAGGSPDTAPGTLRSEVSPADRSSRIDRAGAVGQTMQPVLAGVTVLMIDASDQCEVEELSADDEAVGRSDLFPDIRYIYAIFYALPRF